MIFLEYFATIFVAELDLFFQKTSGSDRVLNWTILYTVHKMIKHEKNLLIFYITNKVNIDPIDKKPT